MLHCLPVYFHVTTLSRWLLTVMNLCKLFSHLWQREATLLKPAPIAPPPSAAPGRSHTPVGGAQEDRTPLPHSSGSAPTASTQGGRGSQSGRKVSGPADADTVDEAIRCFFASIFFASFYSC